MNKKQSRQRKLAREIAKTLNDTDAMQAHYEFTEKYTAVFLRKILKKVMSIPERDIKRSRAALFTYLLNKHGK